MALFNQGYPASYTPMYPQANPQISYNAMPQQETQSFQQHANDSNLMFVNGLQEANAWVVQPGHRAFLMDRNTNTFYVKSVNENGMPNPLEIYDYTKRDQEQMSVKAESPEYITRQEFEERLAKLSAPKRQPRRKKETENVKSDV